MNLKGVLRVDEEGVEEGYRDEQEESDEVHCSRQHPQTLGAVGGRQRSDHTMITLQSSNHFTSLMNDQQTRYISPLKDLDGHSLCRRWSLFYRMDQNGTEQFRHIIAKKKQNLLLLHAYCPNSITA